MRRAKLIKCTIIIITIFIANAVGIFDLKECSRPLGMESGRIKDEQITASSSHDAESTGPHNARIRTERGSGAWCPKRQINAEITEWLQIDLLADVAITGVETQGRYDSGRGMEYVPAYMIEYWRDGIGEWVRYQDANRNEIITANSDTRSTVLRPLSGAIIARNIRIIPVSEITRTVCMRVELYGCPFEGHLVSYSVADGNAIDGLILKDFAYDGHLNASGILVNGLGLLYDGVIGEDNFEKYPNGWVGWRRDIHGSLVTIELFFGQKKTISALLFHVSNFLKYRAQVFERAHLWFSAHGSGVYSPRTIHFSYAIDKNFQSARWVRIPVPNRVAKQVRVELTLAKNADWLILSEIGIEYASVDRAEQQDSSDENFEEEIEFSQSSSEETITYFTVDNTIEENNRWISVAIVVLLLSLTCALSVLLYLIWICCRSVPVRPHGFGSSAPNDVRLLVDRSTVKRVSSNSYRIPSDGMQNFLFKKLNDNADVGSEYADPDCMRIDSDHGTSSTALCESSRSPSKSPTFHYAANDITFMATNCYDRSSIKHKNTLPPLKISRDDITNSLNSINILQIDPEIFQYRDYLGRCKFGEVLLCQLESRLVTVQNLMKLAGQHLMDEYKNIVLELSSLRHQNVIESVGIGNDDQPTGCVTEFIPLTLDEFMRKQLYCRESVFLSICTQIAAGMSYLESRNNVHRNLKASSCFITPDGTVKIGRFWIATDLDNLDHGMNKCVPNNVKRSAVESIIGNVYSTKSDMWAFGVVMWEILGSCQFEPYEGIRDDEVIMALTYYYETGTFQLMLEQPENCPSKFYETFLVPCWKLEPDERPSFRTVHRRLQNMSCSQMNDTIDRQCI